VSVLYHRGMDKRLDEIDKFIEPEAEMDPIKDHLIGVMSDDLKRLFTLWRSVDANFHKLAEESEKLIPAILPRDQRVFEDLKARFRSAEVELNLLNDEETALKKMFWLSVRKEFPLAKDKSVIGVFRGFKIAWCEEEKLSGINLLIV